MKKATLRRLKVALWATAMGWAARRLLGGPVLCERWADQVGRRRLPALDALDARKPALGGPLVILWGFAIAPPIRKPRYVNIARMSSAFNHPICSARHKPGMSVDPSSSR
jgi:hypothetical protein